jgi:hypothetical protein
MATFPNVIARLIAEYGASDYELLPWIPLEKLSWPCLTAHPKALRLLLDNLDKISWANILDNPGLMSDTATAARLREFVLQNDGRLSRVNINEGPLFIPWLRDHPDDILWPNFCSNPGPIKDVLLAEIDRVEALLRWPMLNEDASDDESRTYDGDLARYRISWYALSSNPSEDALDVLEKFPGWIQSEEISANTNPRAIKLLRAHSNMIVWHILSRNPGKAAIELLRENPDKINWLNLQWNASALELLNEHVDKFDDEYARYYQKYTHPSGKSVIRRTHSYDWKNASEDELRANFRDFISHTEGTPYDYRANLSARSDARVLEHVQELIAWDHFSTNDTIFRPRMNEIADILCNRN